MSLIRSTGLAAVAVAAALFAVPQSAEARDRVQITGSSTVFPFTTAVAERFGQRGGRTPIVESTGTGGGMRLFCAGVGTQTPDIANASRRITASEFQTCRTNGVEIIELQIGFDGIVLANAKGEPEMNITLEQLYLALAQEVPVGPNNSLVRNPHRNWSDISPTLPNKRIEVIGPPPTSGTRDSFNELGLLAGCRVAQQRLTIQIEPRRCQAIRDDGAFVEGGENDNIIVQRLIANRNSYGVFGYSFLEENQDKLQGARINGIDDTVENIQSGRYPLARSMFVYFKRNHIGVVPGLQEFLNEYASEAALSEDGYLAQKGLVAMQREARQRAVNAARQLTTLRALTN